MKRVETININGIVFSIDNDAFGKLGSYLDVLGKYFENEQGGSDIIADIEARIAELFNERNNGNGNVVTIEDVTKVIETLGTPEDIAGAGADETTDNERRQSQPQPKKKMKRLYRDPDQRFLGGVCSGIAAWAGISPAVIRLIFIVIIFFFGASIAIYCLLWIIIPKAKTTAQKLEMRGEPVTIGNIEKNIRESFSDTSFQHSFRDFLNEFGEFIGKIIGIFGRILAVLLGLFMFFWGVILAIGLTSVFFMQDIIFSDAGRIDWDFLSFTELFRHIISPVSYVVLTICAILTATLLVSALIFLGAKLIAGSNLKYRLLHVALAVLLFFAIVTGIVTCISQVRNFAWRNEVVETRLITPADTLYLSLATTKLQISNSPMDIYFDKDNICFYGKPNLDIQKSEDGQTKLRLIRESQGESKRAAYQYAENIEYYIDIRDSLLVFDPFFMVTPQDKWKFQRLDLTLYIPEGVVVIVDNALRHDRIFGRWARWRSNDEYIWIMTENKGLQFCGNKSD